MTILVMADLEMLVLSKAKFDAYDDEFFDRFFTVAEEYHEWVQTYEEAKWLFSDDLLEELENAFPWKATSPRLRDLRVTFWQWLQRARAQMQLVTLNDYLEFELQPNIHAGYVEQDYPDLLLEWLNVLATNIDLDPNQTLIFSFEGKPNQVVLLHPNDQSNQTLPLIRDEGEWQAALAESDLWLKHQLPKEGAYPYVPATSYRQGDKEFPRQFYAPRQAVAFQDNQGRLWVADTERGQRHWDVQCPPFGHGRYFKVSPDGRLLGQHAPC